MRLSRKLTLGAGLCAIIYGGFLSGSYILRSTVNDAQVETNLATISRHYENYNKEYGKMDSSRELARMYEVNIVGMLLGFHEYYPIYKPEGFTNPNGLGVYTSASEFAGFMNLDYKASEDYLAGATDEQKEVADNALLVSELKVEINYTHNPEDGRLQQWVRVSLPSKRLNKRIMLVYNSEGKVEDWVE